MKIDYLTFTVFGIQEGNELSLWDVITNGMFGPGELLGYGGRGYRQAIGGLLGVTMRYDPKVESERGRYVTFNIPGAACSCMTPDYYQGIEALRLGGIDIQYTRIDLAFDDNLFSVEEFLERILAGNYTGSAHRSAKSLNYNVSPYQEQDTGGKIGTMTVYLGAPTSERRLRVYNKHGYTRVELQSRDKWAQGIAMLLFGSEYKEWERISKGYLAKFLDFEDWDMWQVLLSDYTPSELRVYSARVATLERAKNWIARQVLPVLHVLMEDNPSLFLQAIKGIENKRLNRWRAVLDGFDEYHVNMVLEQVDNLDMQ